AVRVPVNHRTGMYRPYRPVQGGGNGPPAAGVFSDFGRSSSAKQETGIALTTEGRGSNSGRQNGDGTEPLYLKGSEEEAN
ncbi:hypothetical protein BHM03_00061029, partial [Ensete ventricosum]